MILILWNSLFLEREAMSKNGDEENEKILEMFEKTLDAREKYKKIILLLILILALSSLLLLAQFLQNSQTMIIDTSSKEIPGENEIKNFSIPEIIYKSFESKIKEKGNSNFKIITSVEKFFGFTIESIDKSNKEIEKECRKDFYELSSTIYCRKR